MRTWGLFAALVMALGVAAIVLLLHPPGRLVLAAGPEGGAYVQIAEAYRRALGKDGIEVEIVHTEGSIENADLLSAGKVDAAILQGGTAVDNPDIEAIGAIFYEPFSFVARAGTVVETNPGLWRGLRINSGRDGSGTAAAFRDFEAAVGLSETDNRHLSLSYARSVEALLAGDLDIAVFVAPVDAPYLTETYGDLRLHFLRIDHAEAISRRMVYADTVNVPAGAISLNPVLPPEPITFIALKARLAVTGDLHPALVNRLTMAAIDLHSERGIITDHKDFPSVEGVDLPMNNAARQLIVEGPSTWHDWLPYWIAAQINRVLLLLLPFVFIVLPLLRLLPSVYAFFMRWRVWQHYPELSQIEEDLAAGPDAGALDDLERRLRAVETRIANLRLPPAYRQGQYDARLHVDLIHKRIETLRDAAARSDQNNARGSHVASAGTAQTSDTPIA